MIEIATLFSRVAATTQAYADSMQATHEQSRAAFESLGEIGMIAFRAVRELELEQYEKRAWRDLPNPFLVKPQQGGRQFRCQLMI